MWKTMCVGASAAIIRRAFHVPSIIAQNLVFKLGFCTSNSTNLIEFPPEIASESVEYNRKVEERSLSCRIEKLRRGEPVASAFQSWMGEGFPIQRGDIFNAVNRLRRLKLTKRALEMMEWVIREKPYRPKELEYSYLLEFTTKLHGVSQGESLFSKIPSEFKNELLYNNLVLGCLEKGCIRLSLAYMKKMRELGYPVSYLAFNRLILLHSSSSRRKAIREILTLMKAYKAVPHVSTYNILLKIEANEHNVEGLLKVVGDMQRMMVEANEISYSILAVAHATARLYTACEAYVDAIEKSMTGLNWSTLDILMMLYGCLGKKKDLERIWLMIRELPHVRVKSFVLAIEAFGKIRELGRAEELWIEMESRMGLNSTEQFNSMIGAYSRHGLITKATRVFKDMEKAGCNSNAITFRHLVFGCLKAGLTREAVKTLELGMNYSTTTKIRRSAPWLETTFSILEIFADNADIERTEMLFEELKQTRYARHTFVYNALIKVYVRAKVYKPDLLKRMILGASRPDSETYSLVKLVEQFRS